MGLSRYAFSRRTKNGQLIHPSKCYKIHRACVTNTIQSTVKILEEGERLDQLAGVMYGDGTLWWVIAAASGIGWCMQVPPGTRLRIPTNPGEAISLLL